MSAVTKAQKPIQIADDSMKFGSSTMPALSVFIPEVSYETILKDWTKELQSGTRSKVVQRGDEVSIFGAKIKQVSDHPVNVYSKVANGDNGVNLKVAMELERDRFIGDAEHQGARDYLFDFAKNQYLDLAKNQLDNEKKTLRDLQNDLNGLEKEQARLEKSNQNNKEIIASEKGKLKVLNESLATISDTTRQHVTDISGMGATDPDKLKDLEKQRKKTMNDIQSSEKKIARAEKDLDENDRKLPANTSEQAKAKQQVAEQQAVVQKFEDKVESIKNLK
jgi:hypothetical protein